MAVRDGWRTAAASAEARLNRDLSWVLLYTKPRAEAWAEINLRKDGFTTLLPRVRHRAGFTALFPRYLIAGFRDEDSVTSVCGSLGILYVVPRGDAPALLPKDVVRELKSRMGPRGIVTLDPAPSTDSLFAPSRRVRVRALLRRAQADLPTIA
jgi:hypothetical protein